MGLFFYSAATGGLFIIKQRNYQPGTFGAAGKNVLVRDPCLALQGPDAGLVAMDGIFREIGRLDIQTEAVAFLDLPEHR